MKMTLPAVLAVLAAVPTLASAQDTLRIATQSDITSIYPGVDRSGFTDDVMLNIVEGLVGYKNDLSVGPVLAKSIDISDDGLTYTFPLREGVTFHNGAPMTAQSVVASWERYMSPETNWRCLDAFNGENGLTVESVTATDDMTVEYKISNPSPLFLKDMARFDCGSTPVVHMDSFNEDGSIDRPIGTGPFQFGEWQPGQRIVLEKFADYTSAAGPSDGMTGGKTPSVDRILFSVVPDGASAKAAMRAGEVDLLDISTSDIEEMRDAGFEVLVEMTPRWGAFLISRHNETMQDQKLRQALAKAIDTEQLAMLMGYDAPNVSPIPPVSSFYTKAQQQNYGYDLEGAKALLAESSYDGTPITVVTSRRSPVMFDQAVVAQSMWKKAGIETELEVLEWGTQLDLYRSGDYQVMAFGFSARLDPALSWGMFSGPQQRKVWADEDALAEIANLSRETDDAKRAEISDKLMGMFVDRVPAIGLYSQPAAIATNDRVSGFEVWPGGKLRLWNTSVGG